MPNIESLMQEWPAEFEDLIKQASLDICLLLKSRRIIIIAELIATYMYMYYNNKMLYPSWGCYNIMLIYMYITLTLIYMHKKL